MAPSGMRLSRSALSAVTAARYTGLPHDPRNRKADDRMSRSLNKVMLIGNVGSDPEIKTTGSGTRFAKLSLATNRTFSDRSGQQQEKTEWHRLTFWDKMAELVEKYVKKGDRLYIEGRLEYSTTKDDNNQERYWTDIIVREMVMLGGGPGGEGGAGGGGGYRRQPPGGGGGGSGAGGGGRQGSQQSGPNPFDDDDDLPF
jgi:single-strand DNA-binding protein